KANIGNPRQPYPTVATDRLPTYPADPDFELTGLKAAGAGEQTAESGGPAPSRSPADMR
ncbi:hypothetical protein AALO_G00030220, partial [Alosa alosa]